MPEGKRAVNSVIVRSLLGCETCGGVSAQWGSQWEQNGYRKAGKWLRGGGFKPLNRPIPSIQRQEELSYPS